MRYTVTDQSGNWLATLWAKDSAEAEALTRGRYPGATELANEKLVTTPLAPDQRGFYIGVTALDKLCQTN